MSCQSSGKTPPDGVFSQSFTNSSLPVTAIHFYASTIGPRLRRRPANVRYGSKPAARSAGHHGEAGNLDGGICADPAVPVE